MFNKPSIFNRNDPIAHRDNASAPGAGSRPVTQTPGVVASRNLNSSSNSAAKEPIGNTAPHAKAPSIDAPAIPSLNKDSGETSGETPMGARLIVGPDVKLKGAEILDCDTLVVEGRVEATMDSRVIRIAENGSFSGKVSIDIAEIHGTFDGELTARSQLIIHSTGRVSGKVRYGKLVADEGCELCGDINTLSETSSTRAKSVSEPFLALSAAAG